MPDSRGTTWPDFWRAAATAFPALLCYPCHSADMTAGQSAIWPALILVVLLCPLLAWAGSRPWIAGVARLMQPFGRERTWWARGGNAAAASAYQICLWLAPCVWVSGAAALAAYLAYQVWPQLWDYQGWVALAAGTFIAFGLSYAPATRARTFFVVVAIVAVVVLGGSVICMSMALYRHAHAHASHTAWILGDDGNPAQVPDSQFTAEDGETSALLIHPRGADAARKFTWAQWLGIAGSYAAPSALVIWQFVQGLARRRTTAPLRAWIAGVAAVCGVLLWVHACLLERVISDSLQSQWMNAAGSAAPIGDIMQLVGMWMFGSARGGWWFMMGYAGVIFLVLLAACWESLAVAPFTDERPAPLRAELSLARAPRPSRHFPLLLRAGLAATCCATVWLNWTAQLPGIIQNYVGGVAAQESRQFVSSYFVLLLVAMAALGYCLLYSLACLAPSGRVTSNHGGWWIALLAGTLSLLLLAGVFTAPAVFRGAYGWVALLALGTIVIWVCIRIIIVVIVSRHGR